MPTFNFECTNCETIVELRFSGKPPKNIECKDCNKKLIRKFSAFNIGEPKTKADVKSRRNMIKAIEENRELMKESQIRPGDLE